MLHCAAERHHALCHGAVLMTASHSSHPTAPHRHERQRVMEKYQHHTHVISLFLSIPLPHTHTHTHMPHSLFSLPLSHPLTTAMCCVALCVAVIYFVCVDVL